MINFGEISEALLKCESEEDLTELVLKTTGKFGYDNLVVSTFDKKNGPRVVHATVPDGWANTYFEQAFYEIDPAYKVQETMWRPHTWRSILPVESNKRVDEFVGVSAECGLKHGLTASASHLGRKLNFAISTRDTMENGFEDHLIGATHLLCAGFSARLSCLQSEQALLTMSIREQECVQWIVAGLTNGQIAERMNISVKTVEEFIRRISAKNNLGGRMQIAVSAILAGQVHL